LIKKKDDQMKPGYDIDKFDYSVLSGRSMPEIAGDTGSAEWQSNRASAGRVSQKNAWLADSIAKHDKQASPEPTAKKTSNGKSSSAGAGASSTKSTSAKEAKRAKVSKKATTTNSKKKDFALDEVKGASKQPMPRQIHPMLATLVDDAFDDPDWLYEI